MTAIRSLTDVASADDCQGPSGTASAKSARGSETMARESEAMTKHVDFSRVNLHYLICARDLARTSPARAAVLLGVADALVQLLAQLKPETLVAVTEIKAPLLVLRQEPWWWKRLFAALRADRPAELQTILEQAGLFIAKG